ALDNAISGDTVWIKNDSTYEMDGVDQQAAAFDVDVDNNIEIKGFKSNIGDCDEGGTYYQDTTDGYAIIDAKSGAFDVFDAGDFDYLRWHNIKIVNSNQNAFNLTPTTDKLAYLLDNCWVGGVGTSGKAVSSNYVNGAKLYRCIIEGSFSTSPIAGAVFFSASSYSPVIAQCVFNITGAERAVYYSGTGMMVLDGCIFNIADVDSQVIRISNPAVIKNNVICNSGEEVFDGIKVYSGGKGARVYNNIIAGVNNSILDGDTYCYYIDHNDFYDCSANPTIGNNNITANPQFVDAA
ncbi:unnamed protein product, partial [marine sediment metagenome]